MKRKVLWLLALALVTLFAVAACGNGNGDSAADDTPAAQEDTAHDTGNGQADAGPAVDVPADHDPWAHQAPPSGPWYTPYELPVALSGVLDMGADWVFEGSDSHHDNPWTRVWQDEFNVHVEWLWAAQGDYVQRMNMAIAAGNLPDVFMVNNLQFRQAHQAGLLLDITHYYNTYASQRIRDRELEDPYSINNYIFDGSLFGVPRYYYGIIDQPRHMWVRRDWYEGLGSPEINTVADFEDMARAFMSEFGADYGISTSNTMEWLWFTAPMFGAYVGNLMNSEYFWHPDETGRIRAGVSHPEFRTALTYWQRWFSEGILSADFMNMDDMRAHEDVVNSRVGIQPFWQWWGWMNGPHLVGTTGIDESYMIPLLWPTVEGGPARGQIGFPNHWINVVHRDTQNPAAVMKIMSHVDHMIFSPDANLSAEMLSYFTDGQREHAPGPFKVIDPQADMLQRIHVQHALDTGDTSDLFTAGMQKKHADSVAWINDRDPMGLGAFLQMGFPGSSYANALYLIERDHLIFSSMWGPPPLEFDQTANTGDILVMGIMQIIMGVQPVDYWDTVLDEWWRSGGQIMEDAVNLHYGG